MLKAIPLVLFRYPSLSAIGAALSTLGLIASLAVQTQAAPLPNVVYDGAPAAFAAQPEPAAPAAVQPLASRQEPTAQPEPLRQELVAVAAPPTAQPPIVEAPPAPSSDYIVNVAQQAPHTPRANPAPAPQGEACEGCEAQTPPISEEQRFVIVAQVPHGIRGGSAPTSFEQGVIAARP